MSVGFNGSVNSNFFTNNAEIEKLQQKFDADTQTYNFSSKDMGTKQTEHTGSVANVQTYSLENTKAAGDAQAAKDVFSGLTKEFQSLSSEFDDLNAQLQDPEVAKNDEKLADIKNQIEAKKQEVESKKQEMETAEKEYGVKDQAAKAAEVTLQKAEAKAKAAEETLKTVQAQNEKDKTTMDTSGSALENAKIQAQKETKNTDDTKDDKGVKTGGTQKEVKTDENGNTTKTTTKTMNSKEFVDQENKTIRESKDIQQDYKEGVTLSEENSLVETERGSARIRQTEYMAGVEYTPEITRKAGSADVFQDDAASGNNRLSSATSAVRDKNDAIKYYLEKSGIEPTGVDQNGNPKYSPADIYAAETAVSALQPDIVNNAKATNDCWAKFREGNVSKDEADDAINKLQNGSTFNDGDALGKIGTESVTRTVGTEGQKLEGMSVPLLSDAERDALVGKLEKMKSGEFEGKLSQRELNALSYLNGTSDVQGFPTVPAGMSWNLPAELMTTTEISRGGSETYVTNFENGIKVLSEEGTDGHRIFGLALAKQHSDTHIIGFQNKSGATTEAQYKAIDQNIDKADYSTANVKWRDLEILAQKHGGTLCAQDFVDAGMIDKDVLATLDNPGQRYEIHKAGNEAFTWSIEKMTDGDSKTGRTNLGFARRTAAKENGGYVITGGKELTRTNTSELYSYKKVGNKVELVKEENPQKISIQSWVQDAQRRYQEYKEQGLIQD